MVHPFLSYLIERDIIDKPTADHMSGRAFIREPIGMIAVSHGLLNAVQIDEILDRQRSSSDRFGEIAVSLGCLTREQVDNLVSIQDFRTACSIAEALTLSGQLRYEEAVRYLGAFFASDAEMAEMIAER